jgi:aminoglycoside phosphotransferase (APT) family kinase protein
MFARGAIVMRERYADQLGAAALATIDQVAPLVGPWSAATSAVERLIHTDARVDNIIFKRTALGVEACLIDLQSMAIGDPAYDVAYFLSGSLDPADRAACERRLVEAHAAALPAGAISSAISAWENYRQYAIAGMVATVSAASMLPQSPPIDRLLVALARRNCAAVQELGGVEAAQRRIARN